METTKQKEAPETRKQILLRSRKAKREIAEGNIFAEKLLAAYIKYKAKHLHTEKGIVLNEECVNEEKRILNNAWRQHCNKKRLLVQLPLSKFINRANVHDLHCMQIAWTGYVMTLCKEKYGFSANFDDVLSAYAIGRDCEEGATYICAKINSNT